MTPPDAARSTDSPASAASAGQSLTGWLACLFWVAVGVAVRIWWAGREALPIGEWEARGFAQAWGPMSLSGWSRFTPPLAGWSLRQLGQWQPMPGIDALRLGAVALSVLSLGCAFLLVGVLARSTRLERRSLGRGLAWVAAVWALQPSLVASSVSPTNDGVLGGALCLALCGPALMLGGRSWLGWPVFVVGLLASLLAGGVAVAAAVLVGMLVFVLPIPRFADLARVFSALVVAGALAWSLLGISADGRMAAPDDGPAASVSAMLRLPEPAAHELAVHPDRRTRELYSRVGAALTRGDVGYQLGAAFERVVLEQLAPLRFADMGSLAWPLGLLDLFLRGGALLFAVAVLGRLRPKADSSWPRPALVAAWVTLAVLRAVAGLGPWAFAPLDLVLLGVAGAGATASRHDQRGVRWLAFALGGTLACSLALAPALSDRGASPWLRDLGHETPWGADMVRRLADGGPTDAGGHVAAAEFFMLPNMPSLRMPEFALEQAMQAIEIAPDDDAATGALLRAYVENLRIDDAVELGAGWFPNDPAWNVRAKVMPSWAREQARRLRQESED